MAKKKKPKGHKRGCGCVVCARSSKHKAKRSPSSSKPRKPRKKQKARLSALRKTQKARAKKNAVIERTKASTRKRSRAAKRAHKAKALTTKGLLRKITRMRAAKKAAVTIARKRKFAAHKAKSKAVGARLRASLRTKRRGSGVGVPFLQLPDDFPDMPWT